MPEDITPKQALQNLYSATRKISAEADIHDLMKHWYMIVQKALTPAVPETVKPPTMDQETIDKIRGTMDTLKLDKDIQENFSVNNEQNNESPIIP